MSWPDYGCVQILTTYQQDIAEWEAKTDETQALREKGEVTGIVLPAVEKSDQNGCLVRASAPPPFPPSCMAARRSWLDVKM